ncbi:murein hydrolase activator EnvC family protein [Paenisporosarcina cavernae]|uniref:Peptidase M23 n=1 Tax=Paenisporosarcina cavernae TaxID=2320858 RepID=A0A385YQF2_9BACL|nr:M23 family metallopeptidase [Paenisporosarcina cavernae]AYC28979.1 peptidase M23 [Paenisporosarcina cavernae]
MRKSLLLGLTLVVGLSFSVEPIANASTLDDLKKSQSELNQKKSKINSEIKTKEKDINVNQTRQEQITSQIQALDAKIIEANDKIEKILNDIKITNLEIEKLKESIKELEKKIADRDELIKERIRAVQASGGSVSYIDVLLGANSFADFIDRFSAVNTLMDADRKILQEQSDDKKALEEQKASVEEKLATQEARRDQLVTLKKQMDAQKAEKNRLIDELEKEQAQMVVQKEKLEKEHSEILKISADVQAKIVSEQKRLAEVARQAEIARKKREAEERKRQQASSGVSVPPAVSSGTWTRPAAGRFTSGYGGRDIGEGGEFHYGVDIANSIGTPIVAAADGVVSYAAPLSTFGNVVMVTHSIDGQIYTTVYAHMSAFSSSVGQVVQKGQIIGRMGNTGRSTGPHTHFEIHIGYWAGQSHGSVNPTRYVSF